MIVYNRELVEEIVAKMWSPAYVDRYTQVVMLRMANKGFVVNGAYSERALRSSIANSTLAVGSEDLPF